MAGAIKLTKTTQARALRPGPPNMHLLSLRKLAQRTRSDRWEQYQRLASPAAYNWEGFGSKPEWTATTRLLFEITGFDFNGPPPRRGRQTMRIDGDPEAVVNVRELLEEDETEEPAGLSFDPGPIVWDELDAVETPVGEPAALGFEALEIYEPPEPEGLDSGSRKGGPAGTAAAGPAMATASPAEEQAPEHMLLAPAEEEDVQPEAVPEETQRKTEPVEVISMAPAPEVEPPALRLLELPGPGLNAEPLLPTGARLQLPAVDSEPLRPKLVLDAPPAAIAVEPVVEAKAAVEAAPVEAPVEAARTAPPAGGGAGAGDRAQRQEKEAAAGRRSDRGAGGSW